MATEREKTSSHLQTVRGLKFLNTSRYKKKNIEDAMDYVPKDGDVIICSYPKTGTTWLQYIVMQVMSKATQFSSFDDMLSRVYPYLEIAGVEAVENLTGSRVYMHHLPYNLVQKNIKSKCIYIYRNPEDTVVSFYHFYKNMYPEMPFVFDQFFNDFLTGNMHYGSYFEHVMSFFRHRNDSNLLMLSYEKLHAENKQEILKIAKFLGEEHYLCLTEQEDILDNVMEHTSFEYMKRNLYFTRPEQNQDKEKKYVDFFRKGVVGDGKNTLSEEQRERLKEAAKATLDGTVIFKEWYHDGN